MGLPIPMCAGHARLLAGDAPRAYQLGRHASKHTDRGDTGQRAKSRPKRVDEKRVAEGNCIPVKGAERKPEAKTRADRTGQVSPRGGAGGYEAT